MDKTTVKIIRVFVWPSIHPVQISYPELYFMELVFGKNLPQASITIPCHCLMERHDPALAMRTGYTALNQRGRALLFCLIIRGSFSLLTISTKHQANDNSSNSVVLTEIVVFLQNVFALNSAALLSPRNTLWKPLTFLPLIELIGNKSHEQSVLLQLPLKEVAMPK